MALTQRAIVKSAISVTKVASQVLGMAGERGDLVKGCTDALAILGHASRDFSLRRRAAIRPFLNKPIQRICDESTPITDKLFGDNLSITLKEAHTHTHTHTHTRERARAHTHTHTHKDG